MTTEFGELTLSDSRNRCIDQLMLVFRSLFYSYRPLIHINFRISLIVTAHVIIRNEKFAVDAPAVVYVSPFENFFFISRYAKYYKRCLVERKRVGIGCSEARFFSLY